MSNASTSTYRLKRVSAGWYETHDGAFTIMRGMDPETSSMWQIGAETDEAFAALGGDAALGADGQAPWCDSLAEVRGLLAQVWPQGTRHG